jgi:hypothetical protein
MFRYNSENLQESVQQVKRPLTNLIELKHHVVSQCFDILYVGFDLPRLYHAYKRLRCFDNQKFTVVF